MLYHGSSGRGERPLLAKGKQTNDYGLGAYRTENVELAKAMSMIKLPELDF